MHFTKQLAPLQSERLVVVGFEVVDAPMIVRSTDCLLTTLPTGEGVVLHLQTRRYVAMNATGVCVWQALERGPRSEDQLATIVASRFAIDVATARRDVTAFVAALRAEHAVTTT